MADKKDKTNNHEIEFTESEIETINKFKLPLYMSLKNLYDKWICSYKYERFKLMDPKTEFEAMKKKMETNSQDDGTDTIFNNFIYVDSFYNDISNIFPINPKTLYDIIRDHSRGVGTDSVYNLMYNISAKNKLLLFTLPVYNNYYTTESIANMFKPNSSDPGLSVHIGNTFVCMYLHPTAKTVNDGSSSYLNEAFDIADITGKITQEAVNGPFRRKVIEDEQELNVIVPAFGVTYGRQNQSLFYDIKLNMDSPKVNDVSISNMLMLANIGNTNGVIEPNTVAQDLYSIYSNQAYQCTVEMFGCMNIMPMMYFQLNNIPMFRGAYMITNVEHNVVAGKITTKFTGTRISKNRLPYVGKTYSLAPYVQELRQEYGLNGGEVKNNAN